MTAVVQAAAELQCYAAAAVSWRYDGYARKSCSCFSGRGGIRAVHSPNPQPDNI
jgi:hypothetical protein